MLHKYNLPTILPDAPISASMNKPSIMSKNPQAEDPSINGDDKLGSRPLTGGTDSEGGRVLSVLNDSQFPVLKMACY